VAYSLDFQPIRAALRSIPGLSRLGRVKLYANIIDVLRNHGDVFRNDPALRVAPGSPEFRYHAIMADSDGDGRYHSFVFIVDDSGAAYGVLKLTAVEHVAGLPPP
jgi:hypothetical protein